MKKGQNFKAADLCEDNRIDVFDLVLMRKKVIENTKTPSNQ